MKYEDFVRLQPGDRIECFCAGDYQSFFVAAIHAAIDGDDPDINGEGHKDYVSRAWVVRMPWHDMRQWIPFRRVYCRLPISE